MKPGKPSGIISSASGIISAYVPSRGDIVWVDFDPQVGREQKKRRPAIVISPQKYNKVAGLFLVCPTTSKAKGYPFEVPLIGSMKTSGVVLADQIKSFDWVKRNAVFIEVSPIDILDEVLNRIEVLIF